MIPPFLTLSNIRYISRVKWSNPRKGVAPSPTLQCSRYWKGSLLVVLVNGRQLYLLYIKVKIDNPQQNCMFRLWGDRNEIINHKISECSKLAQREFKTRHDWVGKVIHWELCKKLKFKLTTKWDLRYKQIT